MCWIMGRRLLLDPSSGLNGRLINCLYGQVIFTDLSMDICISTGFVHAVGRLGKRMIISWCCLKGNHRF